MTAPHSTPARPGSITPLWSAFAFTFLNSVGTFVATSGIFFLTKHGYGFTEAENYLLGVLLGITYIAGAMGAGPLIRRLKQRFASLTSRGVLIGLMAAMCVLCAVPWMSARLMPPPMPGARPAAWPMWTLVLLYSPLTGVLWPMVESYVSGGRRGHDLRSTIGWWNVVWSSALILSSVVVSPLVKHHAALALLLLGGVHVSGAVLARSFGPEPGEHATDEPHQTPESYPKLLMTFRLLLPMSYLVSSALLPYLPTVLERVGVPVNWSTLVAAVWLLARSLSFYGYQRWGGWHGRWWPAIAGPGALLGGFAAAVLASHTLSGLGAVVLVLGGLALFGVGMASIYSGALYYAMEVGEAEVDAGGKHEALIGVGYTTGPLCGLLAVGAAGQGWISPQSFEPAMLAAVAAVCAVVVAMVLRRVVRHSAA